MASKINVLLVVKRYAGNYPLLNEMVKLDPDRFRTVICYLGGKDDGNNRIVERVDRACYLGLPSRQLKPYNSTLLRQLKEIIDKENIHVVNCHLHRTAALGTLAARMAKNRPVVLCTLHGLGSAKNFNRKLANWLLYRKVFRVVGVADAVRQDILRNNWGLSPDKVVAIPNGLDLTPFSENVDREAARREILPDAPGGVWFGTAGRLSPVKNHRCLLHAFQKVADTFPDSRLLIAGKGELEGELKDLAHDLGIEGNVALLGFRKDMPRLLAALDVFVFPSLREGLPLSLIEAMASGLPVVASNVGGIPEIVEGGEYGRLVASADVEGLASAMLEVARLPEKQRLDMGDKARKRAFEKFTSARMAEDYEKLYAEAFAAWANTK